MTMRGLIWFVLLFAAAAALALVGVFDGGQVLLVMPPYRVDVSLNLFVVALIVSFIVIYAVLRAIRSVLKMPQRVSAYRTRSRLAKANAALRDAIGHLYAGRFSKAEKSARDSLIAGENTGAAGLIGAKAAHEMNEYARRDEWLAKVTDGDWQDARLMATADMRADGRDADGVFGTMPAESLDRRSHLDRAIDIRELIGLDVARRLADASEHAQIRGDRLLEILQPQLKLIRAQLFGSAAKPIAQEPLDQQPQLVVLSLTLLNGASQRDLLPRCGNNHVSQHLLEDCRVVRQGGEVDLHARMMANPFASNPVFLVELHRF